jgi:hypothetical protein
MRKRERKKDKLRIQNNRSYDRAEAIKNVYCCNSLLFVEKDENFYQDLFQKIKMIKSDNLNSIKADVLAVFHFNFSRKQILQWM